MALDVVPFEQSALEITDEEVDLVISIDGSEMLDLADICFQFGYRLRKRVKYNIALYFFVC